MEEEGPLRYCQSWKLYNPVACWEIHQERIWRCKYSIIWNLIRFQFISIAKLRINIGWITSSHSTCLVKVEREHLSVMQEISYFVERLNNKIDMHGVFRASLIENDLSEIKEFVSKIQDKILKLDIEKDVDDKTLSKKTEGCAYIDVCLFFIMVLKDFW